MLEIESGCWGLSSMSQASQASQNVFQHNSLVRCQKLGRVLPPGDYWLVVEPTHAKNMLVTLEIFPN